MKFEWLLSNTKALKNFDLKIKIQDPNWVSFLVLMYNQMMVCKYFGSIKQSTGLMATIPTL